ncbi:MAG: NAD(P)/FAD-dependent oxidoreductase [Promethearchaeota archaeon]
MKDTYEVCVVGAGPGGSIAAERLAKEGIQVLLVDRHQFPRYKCCAAGVLWHNVEDFPEIKPVIENYNYGMVAHAPSLGREFQVQSKEHFLLGQTYRETLDNHLAQLAKAAGAEFRDNCRVKSLKFLENSKGVELDIHDKSSNEDLRVKANIMIDASGVSAITRKYHPEFRRWKASDLLIASELDVPMSEDKILDIYGKERMIHMFLYFEDLPGYAWIFTKKTSVSIGMGTMMVYKDKNIGGRILASKFKKYSTYLEDNGYIVPGSAKMDETSYALIPSMSIKEGRTFGNNALLVGDAAGVFVSALSGEGIYYAMLSGSYAASTSVQAIRKGDYSGKSLSIYRKLWVKRLKSELNYQYFARNYMLFEKRRCEKAIRWGKNDRRIRKFLEVFFGGEYEIDRTFLLRLVGHYIRLKVKDAFGRMGEKEKKSDYDS